MCALGIILAAGIVFFFGYSWYSRRIEALFGIDAKRKTPAYTEGDGLDYVPAKNWTVLFGHHFASIAGAAPIVGPILAVSLWGWAPTLIWIVLGTVFIGGMHDFASLMISVRHKGASVADIAEQTVSKRAKLVFLSFVWVTLILIISVFVWICAKTLVAKPEIVIPSLGLIPLAVLIGFLMYNLKLNQAGVTILGLAVLAGLIFLGEKFPISLTSQQPIHYWSILLLGYSFIASVIPVQILLQPRDYISSFLLLFGVAFGYIGLLVSNPQISFPAFTGWTSQAGTTLWPVLFITVACGAISGFHSLVASGTTSKQIENETHARRIGYGGMIAEGILATLAVMVIATAFSTTSELSAYIAKGGSGPVGAFGFAYGKMTEGFLGRYGSAFAILVLNGFILTTLDSATRIGRYLTQELFRVKNRHLSTLAVVGLSGWLALSGEWTEIWPIFGSANQLIAALALIVISGWLLGKRKHMRYTILPTGFMIATTIVALCHKIIEYANAKKFTLLTVAVVLLGLAAFVLYETIVEMRKIRTKKVKI